MSTHLIQSASARWRRVALVAALASTPLLTIGAAASDDFEPGVAGPALSVTPLDVATTGRVLAVLVEAIATRPPIAKLHATFGERAGAASSWSLSGRQWLVLVPVDVDEQATRLDLDIMGELEDGSPVHVLRVLDVVEAPYEETRIRVAPRYVKLPKAVEARVVQERKDIAAALKEPSEERLWRGGFIRPTETVETSPFGTLRRYNDRRRQSRHLGLDLDGQVGDPILAIQRGRVVLVQDRYYSGGTVVLDHGQGLFSLYFHMSQFDVEVGDVVDRGQRLGDVGRSGRVTGPHLHLSVKLGGIYQDPKSFFALELDDDPHAPRHPPDWRTSTQEPRESLGP